MRERFDEVEPLLLRKGFNDVFSMIQRNKALESYALLDGYYLFAVDGSKWTFHFANGVPLNDANYDLKVNFLD